MQQTEKIQTLTDWIVQQGLAKDDLPGLLQGFCERIVTFGVPLWRANLSLPTLHPNYEALGYRWQRAQDVVEEQYAHGMATGEDWLRSPYRSMVDRRIRRMRMRLEHGEGVEEYPVLAELKARGATDYLAFMIGFGGDRQPAGLPGMVTSWTTDRAGGFAPSEAALIERLLPCLALAGYRIAVLQVASTLLDAYVGTEAGRRILSGQVRQGTAQRLSAAIVIADLRGFTGVADRTPGEALVAGLNQHLGGIADAVHRHGGQVLKFLGDGLMAVFALEGRSDAACADALAAAEAALAANAAINRAREAAGEPVLALDVALHMGEVMYGNVGSDRRLDFTVIGPAVNEASRIEALCEPLGCHLLMSGAFALTLPGRVRSLGHHTLRGVASPQELFTLAT